MPRAVQAGEAEEGTRAPGTGVGERGPGVRGRHRLAHHCEGCAGARVSRKACAARRRAPCDEGDGRLSGRSRHAVGARRPAAPARRARVRLPEAPASAPARRCARSSRSCPPSVPRPRSRPWSPGRHPSPARYPRQDAGLAAPAPSHRRNHSRGAWRHEVAAQAGWAGASAAARHPLPGTGSRRGSADSRRYCRATPGRGRPRPTCSWSPAAPPRSGALRPCMGTQRGRDDAGRLGRAVTAPES